MIWYKISIRLSDIPLQRDLNVSFTEIYNKNNQPEDLKLFQADPEFDVDYYISVSKQNAWMVTELRTKFKAVSIKKPPVSSKLFLVIGERKKTYQYPPLIR